MAHLNQVLFCIKVKSLFPAFFHEKTVLDVGSMDINGNNRYLFDACVYTGLDIMKGNNVDVIKPVHEYETRKQFSTIISTEMLEHDINWAESLKAMTRLLKPGGFLLITCATTGRPEHGTKRTTPECSPATTDYYRNITEDDIRSIPGWLNQFLFYRFSVNPISHDLQFYGIKDVAGYKLSGGDLVRMVFKPSRLTWIETYVSYWFWRRVRDYKNAFTKTQNIWQSLRVNLRCGF